MSSTTKPYEEKMNASVDHLIRELGAIRAGRANPAVLDKVTVDYYGSPTPINQIAAVAVAEARILTISPWDRQMLKPISKAIQSSDIGINPIDDGQVIRLVFPAPTEERRKQLTKEVQKLGEEAKVAVRNVRRDAMDKFKAMKKAGELTEDDQKKLEEETQKLTDKYVKKIDETCAAKNKEVMEV
ncbi:MAG TPA: ribosome recycling factor [Candidatus Gemmiger avistercoris]|uniref:Ribosome-recycling factor n=1 Tax=Candidatus Gemmiger avistercoris TaxID=2838606 RepID=A0A9D2FJU8_9FIRM|nr:ribosome recycling factor [uncultured Subdoligranulum sp.]HIZ61887.1 ribosome recycling factor [Candidatus Gemmiger avistercoris]